MNRKWPINLAGGWKKCAQHVLISRHGQKSVISLYRGHNRIQLQTSGNCMSNGSIGDVYHDYFSHKIKMQCNKKYLRLEV